MSVSSVQLFVIQTEVSLKHRDCQTDLAKAEPILQAVTAVLDTLNKVQYSNHVIDYRVIVAKPHI